jgi:signal transduction histidine kinase
MTQATMNRQSIGSPISNEAYNVITALQSKLEGLEAYRKYAESSGNASLWQQLAQYDTQAVERLVQELENLVRGDRLRMRTPGDTR